MSEDFMGDSGFEGMEFADNPDPRSPLALVLDCSDSMTDKRPGDDRTPLEALNGGLDVLFNELHKDPLAKRRVETTFIPYGTEVGDPTPFSTVDDMILPELKPMGVTSTGKALTVALDMIENRKNDYKSNGIQYYRPMVMLITDGLATDSTAEVSQRIKDMEAKKGLSFFAVGVEGADIDALSALGTRQGLMLSGLKFDELFLWLSASQASVSASQPGDKVALESPAGWAEL